MTVAEMTCESKTQRMLSKQRQFASMYCCISTDMCRHVLAFVQTKRQGRYYESLKIEAFSVCGTSSRVLRLSFFRTDARHLVNANHMFSRDAY